MSLSLRQEIVLLVRFLVALTGSQVVIPSQPLTGALFASLLFQALYFLAFAVWHVHCRTRHLRELCTRHRALLSEFVGS